MADEYYLYIQICISPFKRDQTHHMIRGSKKEAIIRATRPKVLFVKLEEGFRYI